MSQSQLVAKQFSNQKTSYTRQAGPHFFETKGPNAPKWFVIDASNQVVGRLATIVARVLNGKHKTNFTRHADSGDFVIVTNVEKVSFTRTKWEKKKYYNHTGYVGGLKVRTAKEMLERDPAEILRLAIWGMTNKSSLARHQMKKLKLVVGSEHEHAAQCPQPLPASVVRKTVLAAKK